MDKLGKSVCSRTSVCVTSLPLFLIASLTGRAPELTRGRVDTFEPTL